MALIALIAYIAPIAPIAVKTIVQYSLGYLKRLLNHVVCVGEIVVCIIDIYSNALSKYKL